ncbi:hypothetical protein [Lentzea sp. NPDC051838]|uniref:hypothetical protein n=1 Tax=Lentzea sp. NPDC051838 TaxID=3154849 RepID=UPI00343C515C
MRNTVSGDVSDGSEVVQVGTVHGDLVLRSRRRRPSRRAVPPRPEWFDRARRALEMRLCVAVVLLIFVPTELILLGGFRPQGASDEVIVRLAVDKLRLCASEIVPAPANCPQGAEAPGAQTVRWELVGDPGDAVVVKWRHGSFRATGKAVMVLHYDTALGGDRTVVPFTFIATGSWRGGDTRIEYMEHIDAGFEEEKHGFELSRTAVAEAIRAGFALCTEARSSPMPAGCPRTTHTPVYRDVDWSLNADPLINWDMRQDETTGLVVVLGNYSLALRNREEVSARPPHYTLSGAYQAMLIRAEDGSARLLEIKHLA